MNFNILTSSQVYDYLYAKSLRFYLKKIAWELLLLCKVCYVSKKINISQKCFKNTHFLWWLFTFPNHLVLKKY